MRVVGRLLIASQAVLALCGGAAAAPLLLPNDRVPFDRALVSPDLARSLESRKPDYRLDERPIGELIAVRLGIAQGRAEIFRYRVEGAPSDSTVLDGVVDGGGVKLKLTW